MSEVRLYTSRETQELLRVTQRTLYRYIKAGQLQAIRLGREYRISEDALKAFLDVRTEHKGV